MNWLLKKINTDKIALAFVYLVAGWIAFALTFDLFFIYLHFSGNDELALKISNEIMWKIDGRFH
jgi:hypothetical protein